MSKSLHSFYQNYFAADVGSLIKMKSYWSAKINKPQETGGEKLDNLEELVT